MGVPAAARPALPRGAGRGKLLYLDAFSGIAGDMAVAALLDLGVPIEVVRDAVGALAIPGLSVAARPVFAGAIGATRFEVRCAVRQPERSFVDIDRRIERSRLPAATKQLARRVFLRLAEAEAEVHRVPLASVHFHEVGAFDAIADVVGASAALEHLGAELLCSPLPMGRGFTDSRHGILPLPAPAALLALRGIPTVDAGIPGELVTPTGAALVGALATASSGWPALSPERIGWGAGTRPLPDRPNALRAVLGSASGGAVAAGGVGSHAVLETTVDDVTGELVGAAIAALLEAGALDAWATPATMKKGRPGLVVSVLAREADAERLAAEVLRQLPTLGVRIASVRRVERPRREGVVSTRFGEIPVKWSGGPFGAPVAKPEHDACAARARAAGVALREVVEAARSAIASVGSLELEAGGLPRE